MEIIRVAKEGYASCGYKYGICLSEYHFYGMLNMVFFFKGIYVRSFLTTWIISIAFPMIFFTCNLCFVYIQSPCFRHVQSPLHMFLLLGKFKF